MDAADTGDRATPSRGAVGVGYCTRAGRLPPVLPRGYDLHPIDPYLHTEISTFRICLVAAEPGELTSLLGEAVSLLGEDCIFIACADEMPDAETQMALLEAGADDVVSACDSATMAIALKRAEKAIARAERANHRCRETANERDILQSAIDNLPSPIFFKDRDGIYRGCNKAFERFIRLPADKVRGSSVYDVAPQELAQVYEAADEKLMQAGGVQIYDAEVRFATGEYRHVTFHKAVTRDKTTGRVNGLAGAMLDITERKQLEERLKRAAERDDLTNAYNRRRFFELAGEIEARCRQDAIALSVLVVDVDHFKQINDHFGHACGDAALCHLVTILDAELAEPHIFARAGGEEFYCLLYDCDLRKAYRIAERVRKRVETAPVSFDGLDISLEISIGVADVGNGEKLSQAIIRADQSLYQAKDKGRNRVCTA
ncbi:sensor domain-containing diguanylate cyclase [Roseibium salinum]|uniref:diguanylate cyclase n=1 Tax=Roseibium salinum TaxID=1604349 RepID=A0ABT3QZP6_9HYPH|nr:diguanylate cyclase [Roseibium sp. DSM 29163]MCX2722421.1 diguanylate cyclase [Roseibium sp. DSM 29163]